MSIYFTDRQWNFFFPVQTCKKPIQIEYISWFQRFQNGFFCSVAGLRETTSPTIESLVGLRETPNPRIETLAGLRETTNPRIETLAGLRETTNPTIQSLAGLRETPNPRKETLVGLSKAPYPSNINPGWFNETPDPNSRQPGRDGWDNKSECCMHYLTTGMFQYIWVSGVIQPEAIFSDSSREKISWNVHRCTVQCQTKWEVMLGGGEGEAGIPPAASTPLQCCTRYCTSVQFANKVRGLLVNTDYELIAGDASLNIVYSTNVHTWSCLIKQLSLQRIGWSHINSLILQ